MKESSASQNLKAAGLVLFNASLLYEVLATQHGWDPLSQLRAKFGSWHRALEEGYRKAYEIDYRPAFLYALNILNLLPQSPIVEAALERTYRTAGLIAARAGFLRHDLMGRVFHTLLSQELRKAYATYYTSVPGADLLAWLAIGKWDDKAADLACGTGTLLVASYHKKIALALRQGVKPPDPSGIMDYLHRRYIEEDLWGFDAMAFASHMAAVNLSLQHPSTLFDKSNIYDVPCGSGLLGSLEFLISNKLTIQTTPTGGRIGATMQAADLQETFTVTLPTDGFNVIIMNPPFTRSDRITKALDTRKLKERLDKIDSDISLQAGLAAPFVLLADRYLKSGGRIAFVLPTAILSREEWSPIRDLLMEKYHIEHIVLSWAEGRPSFSENTELRELLLVARKLTTENSGDTLLLLLDAWPQLHIDMRVLAEEASQLKEVTRLITLPKGMSYPLKVEENLLGEATSLPRSLLEQLPSWGFLTTFRDFTLARLYLRLRGLPATIDPDIHIPFFPTVPLNEAAKVLSVVDHVASIGLRHEGTRSTRSSVPVLWGSNYSKIEVKPEDVTYLEPAIPEGLKKLALVKKGKLLVLRRVDIYSSLQVPTTSSDIPLGSNMWWPLSPRAGIRTKDGREIRDHELAKIMVLWFNSTYGLLLFFGDRAETRGAWSEWKKGFLKSVPVINPCELTSKQVNKLVSLYNQLSDVEWPVLHEQLREQLDSRRTLDETIAEIISGAKPKGLDVIYGKLLNDLERLRRVMG